jgi:WD40 repeat protein
VFDGQGLAILGGPKNDQIQVYQQDGQLRFAIDTGARCNTAATSQRGNLLAFDSLRDVVLWDLHGNRHACRLTGHLGTIRSIAFSSDGLWIATGASDRAVRLWHADSGREKATLSGARDEISQVAFTRDGQSLIAADQAGCVRLWHVATGQELCDLDEDAGRVVRLLVSPSGRRIAYLNQHSQITVVSLQL